MRTFFIHFFLTVVFVYWLFKTTDLVDSNAFFSVIAFLLIGTLIWLVFYFLEKVYFFKLIEVFILLGYFVIEMFKANIRISFDILTPHYKLEPAIFALPLEVKSDIEITILAILITLTPGTLSIDLTPDKKILYIHSLYHSRENTEALKLKLKTGFEQRILRITR